MTIISIKTGTGAEFRRIELSDGSFFSFKTCYLPPIFIDDALYTPGTAEGREIGAGEEAGFRFASACLRAEQAALRLIARAEQNLAGLSRKLERRGHGQDCVRTVVSRLAELELLDDRRFARLWTESRLGRAKSPRRLLSGLCVRGIDRDDAEAALNAVLDAETETALLGRFAAKQGRRGAALRFRFSGSEAENARRFLKFTLKSEGFSAAAIERFFEAAEDEAL